MIRRVMRIASTVAALSLAACGQEPISEQPSSAELVRSAEQGDVTAQFDLGLMYATGEGVPQDSVEAVAWYRKAAEQESAAAQNNLGLMSRHRRGRAAG